MVSFHVCCSLLGRERSEEHTSELQSQSNLVCRLLLEKKKTHTVHSTIPPINNKLPSSVTCERHNSNPVNARIGFTHDYHANAIVRLVDPRTYLLIITT